ncbi:DUF6783 domain-containing protein [uncultured Robinsoniella sp.]
MRGKYAAKWGVQMAGMNLQTRSNTVVPFIIYNYYKYEKHFLSN